jgi:hypothetical protein
MRIRRTDRIRFAYDQFVAYWAPFMFDRVSAYSSLAISRVPEAEEVLKKVASGEYGYRKGVDDQVEALDALAIKGTESSLNYVANALTPSQTNDGFIFLHMQGSLREKVEAECQLQPEILDSNPVTTCSARSETYRKIFKSYKYSREQHPNPLI